jgi:hypothetical protein
MSDANGNYQANVADPLIGYTAPQAGPNYYGSGSPEGVVASSPGATYADTAGGTLYFKQTGTGKTGWTIVSGSGSAQIYAGTGNPNGSQSATGVAIFLDSLGNVWQKTTVGASNNQWVQIIAA